MCMYVCDADARASLTANRKSKRVWPNEAVAKQVSEKKKKKDYTRRRACQINAAVPTHLQPLQR